MNRKNCLMAMFLCCVLCGTVLAQGTAPPANKNCPTGDTASQMTGQLMTDGLASILRDGDFARLLGLDEDQFIEAQDIIDAYQTAILAWSMLDPEMMNPQTVQALMMIRIMMDLELYSLLTDEQQKMLEQLVTQHQSQKQNGSTPAATTLKK